MAAEKARPDCSCGPALADVRRRLMDDFPMLNAMRARRPMYVEKLVKVVRDCAEYNERYVMPVALEIDRRMEHDHDYFAWDLVQAALPYRLLSLAIPALVGGVGGLSVMFSLAMEELCSACPGIGNIFGAHALGVSPFLVAGSMAHWESALRDCAESEKAGKPVLMAAAVTEPSAGTDVEEPNFLKTARLSMGAKKVAGGYVLNGTKCFISNGSVADYTVLCCATDRDRPFESWTTFIITKDMEGFSVPRVEEKMGQRACPAAELLFEDCFVPDENVMGMEGDGMQPGTLLLLAASRAPVGAIATGIARGAYEWFVKWANRARAGGMRPIDRQSVQMAIADMKTRIQLARWAYLNAALTFDGSLGNVMNSPVTKSLAFMPRSVRTGDQFKKFFLSNAGKQMTEALIAAHTSSAAVTHALANASMAKAVGGDTAMYISTLALEMMGIEDSEERPWIEKAFRDAKLTQIYEGTNQLNRLVLFEAGIQKSLKIELKNPLGFGRKGGGPRG